MDAIKLLKDDHRKVESLFAEYESMGERAKVSRQRIVAEITKELEIHTQIEEEIFYPAYMKAAKEADDTLEAYEEHHVAKFVLSELKSLDPAHERYTAKVTVLKELIEHHVCEEEKEMFPHAKKVMSREQLTSLGQQMAEMKQRLQTEGSKRVNISLFQELPVQQPENI